MWSGLAAGCQCQDSVLAQFLKDGVSQVSLSESHGDTVSRQGEGCGRGEAHQLKASFAA